MNKPKLNIAYILLGGNMGDKKKNLLIALSNIEEQIGKAIQKSSVYETEPWGNHNQPSFYNQVIAIETTLSAFELIQQLLNIELEMGRSREMQTKWEKRIIDIDILFYNEEVINTAMLIVPHPRLHERNFTLKPLLEIAPKLFHPVLKKSIQELFNLSTDTLTVAKLN